MFSTYNGDFPSQKVDGATKQKADWYANCIDYIISAGLSYNDRSDTELKLNIFHGNIPDSFYKKTLNPYNSSNERYKRFPAVMRNLDIMSDIIRRYVSEYYKGVHDFVVGADNPDIVINKSAALKAKIEEECQLAFQKEFEKKFQEMMNEAQQNGTPPEQVNPADAMPDQEEFIAKFNKDYIDKESKQGQDILNFIRSTTDDMFLYLSAFFNFVALGECYSYSEIKGDKIIKENVPVMEAYPIPNSKFFVEDHDMFARKKMMTYQEILDTFDDVLSINDKHFLETYYANGTRQGTRTKLMYSAYFENYPDVCDKFSSEERDLFRKEPLSTYDENSNLYEVWHVTWRGMAKRGIVTYINQLGFPATRIIERDEEFVPEMGDIKVEWTFESQVYEGYRIGDRYNAIYPIKARPIPFNRDGKLPYNGIMEILPMFGKFSIIKLITPYQVMRNIFNYHREMVIAKNKMLVLLLPESLIASDTEDKIYKMAADGVLLVDDSEDANSQKMAQIRMLNANLGDYINQMTQLMEAVKQEAREIVDMNAQRYGEIAQSSGVSTTQEAIARSSMGSVIISFIFDEFRKRDYNRDLEFAKLAYIEGLDTSYWDELGNKKYISLDVNSFVNSDYSTCAKNDAKENDKIQQLKQWAFNASQNGDLELAVAAITGDNVAQIKDTINKFMEVKRQHEQEMQQADQMLKQQEIENRIKEIQAKGEEDRKAIELEYQYKLQMQSMEVDADMFTAGLANTQTDNSGEQAKLQMQADSERNKQAVAQQKLQLDREKMNADLYSKAADREVKRQDIATKLQIAKTNKNKYDK